MKKIFQAAVVAAAVLAVPAMSLAAQTKPAATVSAQAKPAAKAAPAAVRSARGVVKSMDASSLVLTEKAGKKKKSHDVRFVLDNSTQKDGNVAVGSAVQVKYHNDAKKHVATEVRAAGKKS
jgi:hypothetical protein